MSKIIFDIGKNVFKAFKAVRQGKSCRKPLIDMHLED